MKCSVRYNTFNHAKKHGIINDKRQVIANTKELQEYLNFINKVAREKYGVEGDTVITYHVNNVAFRGLKLELDPINEDIISEKRGLKKGPEDLGSQTSFRDSIFEDGMFNETYEAPLTDNFIELIDYKKSQVEWLSSKIDRLNQKQLREGLSNKDKKEIRSKIVRLNSFKKSLENQIVEMQDGAIEKMYKPLLDDIEKLSLDIENMSDFNLEELRDRKDFLWEFIQGKDPKNIQKDSSRFEGLPRDSEHEPIRTALLKMIDKFNTSSEAFQKEMLENDVFYQDLKKQIEEDSSSQNEVDEKLKSLFEAETDIMFLDKWVLGMSNSFQWDTLYPQLMKNAIEYENHKEQSVKERLLNKLRSVVGDEKDIEFVKEKDEEGNLTGNVLDVYSNNWFIFNFNMKKIAKNFKYTNDKKYKKKVYNEFLSNLRQNTDIFDIRKIKSIKELYEGNEYVGEYFTFSEEEMSSYEASLRNKIGNEKFELMLQGATSQIENYLENKKDSSKSDIYKESLNIFSFIKSLETDNPGIYASKGPNIVLTMFSDLDNLMFYPKEEVIDHTTSNSQQVNYINSDFYSEDYKNLSEKQKEILEVYRENARYVNDTYDLYNHGRLTFPKVMKELNENFAIALKQRKVGKSLGIALQAWKSFYYETGRYKVAGKDIYSNYKDSSTHKINELAKIYKIKGMNSEEAYKKAKQEVLSKYSEDTLKDMAAMMDLAAYQRARENAKPIVDSYFEAFKSIKAVKGNNSKERVQAIEKVKNWIDVKIYGVGTSERESGSNVDKSWLSSSNTEKFLESLSKVPIFKHLGINRKTTKMLTEVEQDLLKELEELKKIGPKGDDIEFSFDNKGTFVKKKVVLVNNKGTKIGEKFIYSLKQENGVHDLTQSEFEEAFQRYIEERIQNLGLDLTTSGIIQGIVKTTILKGLGFNFISGMFNRQEGKGSAFFMDPTGQYWTPGNIDIANEHMLFYNTENIINNVRKKEAGKARTIKNYLNILGVIQDRKNVMDANAEDSKHGTIGNINPFAISVDNAEAKNQGTIALAISMDYEIEDNMGNKVPIFTKDGIFTAFELVNGELVLKDEFKDPSKGINDIYDFMGSDEMFKLKEKIRQAINRSQGNYDPMDTILSSRYSLGKILGVFTKWRWEHLASRFAGGEGYDLSTGKKRLRGRYRHILDNTGASFGAFSTLGLLTAGVVPGIALGTAGVAIHYAIKHFFNKHIPASKIQNEASMIQSYSHFLGQVLLDTLNFPMRLVSKSGSYKVETLFGFKPFESLVKNNKMTQEQAGGIASAAREMAHMLMWMKILLLIKAMTWDDDDEKDSKRRMLHNFMDNQLNQLINSSMVYTNPMALWNDTTRLGAFQTMLKISDLAGAIAGNSEALEKAPKNLLDIFIPIPRMAYKDTLPFQDKYEYDQFEKNFSIRRKWVDDLILDSGPKRQIKEIKESFQESVREQYKDSNKTEEEIEEIVKKITRQRFPSRNKKSGETYEKYLERVQDFDKNLNESF